MNKEINHRISLLRTYFRQENIQALIIPSTDPHLSEYVAPHWQSRKWISGFSGSAGTVVVTTREAGLWTDSRYFLQAATQLAGTEIKLFKLMLPETPDIPTYLSTQLQCGETVGIDGQMFSQAEVEQLQGCLKKSGISLKNVADPLANLWIDRPPIPESQAFIHNLNYAGKSCVEKLTLIRKEMKKSGAEALILSALDEIGWALNLRGNDVHCNPVVVCYLLIETEKAHLFINPQKVTEEVAVHLEKNGITTHPYEAVESFLAQLDTATISADPAKTNHAIFSSIQKPSILREPSPVALLKAIRNEQEIAGLHNVMLRDGIAMVKFLKWLEETPVSKESEISIDRKLHELRAAQPLYMGESFDTIAGYRENAAIVHRSATPETDTALRPEGFLLLDSGAQYLDGTTDITRTIALGPLTEEEKTDYTLILKGHIALATAVFPEGTRGVQLDILARTPIWKRRMNYLHGTGHGVGNFLNVHEGPQSIRKEENPVTLQAGMVTTNEPGVYKEGLHGVRTENMYLIVPAGEGMFGNYLKFEVLTLSPICKKGILPELLEKEETEWLDNYHRLVYEKLSPLLDEAEKDWLKKACAPLIISNPL